MDIYKIADIINSIASGFEGACAKCLSNNSGVIVITVQEQLYSGLSGSGKALSPTYDDDPFFNEEGRWKGKSRQYKAWKRSITPPAGSAMLGLPPRPDNVPNLKIDGTFYSEITASMNGDTLLVDPGRGNGPDIVDKYGGEILEPGPESVRYFNSVYLLPAIERHFRNCGYR